MTDRHFASGRIATTAGCGMLRAFSCGGNVRPENGVVVRLVRLVREILEA